VSEIIQGHLPSVDGQLVLAIELSRVDDGSVLLSHQYLMEDNDLRPVQADLVRDILRGVRTGAGYLRSLTSSSEAYREFLRGESLMGSGSPAELHEAIRHFDRAVTLDPDFALTKGNEAV
jgi:adenylate cyclase